MTHPKCENSTIEGAHNFQVLAYNTIYCTYCGVSVKIEGVEK